MKLARYSYNGTTSIGRVEGDRLIDLAPLLPAGAADVAAVLALPQVLADAASLEVTAQNSIALDQLRLLAPILRPGKFMCLGMNYKDHEAEARRLGVAIPESQVWFSKQITCITGPYDDVHFPQVVERLDYEAEMGVVIGKGGRRISEADALQHVAGYFVANDVSARDWQAKSPTWTLGKSFDTHGPIGPWIVTADEIADPQQLTVSLSVNGERRQHSSTELMTYSVARQIAYLSEVMTLEPGDILITGTPAGVGIAMQPPTFLQVGDVVRVEIEGIGHIQNTIVAEPR
ncbi:2-keto-4-pentenoate hydratase/2-oxohepta-3-ene-1,7-dioic acid hydratase [Pseudomonas sp. GM21]|jgi:2-keto-4-pentenoate hydratase/2-oxohepta-3-ene-1,7-dioic acid hydratase in catechol pathway|uniref:fumarylacetoacetate hydrolase family protein n=1 Tax=Pseudomonas sp. GM21 TaxID=1144325 RepID=UPI0002725972|nr:fumarylacetoacetate hydrolase family protein [Pseudomonas sp. GM21]EJM18863.1 2-keto-4-pentenoate hydratase/2-oxohepta-3-ene-1,7-dioic acid hydratase [Pseudomonas sp. GM21]